MTIDAALDADATAPPVESAPTADAVGDFDFGKKKKKKTPAAFDVADSSSAAPTQTDAVDSAASAASISTDLIDYPVWPDHTYDELISRVYDIMREKNPSLGESKKFQMKPPNVSRAGTKKTAFINFVEICRLWVDATQRVVTRSTCRLKRQPKHVMQFLMAELGTSGSVDGSNQLIIKGRFQQKHFETVLRKYISGLKGCGTFVGRD